MTSLIWLGWEEGRKRGRTVFVFSKGTLSAEAPCVHQGLEKWWLGVGLGHPPYQLHSLLSSFLSFQKSPFLVYSTDISISDNTSESPWDPHMAPLSTGPFQSTELGRYCIETVSETQKYASQIMKMIYITKSKPKDAPMLSSP